VGGLYQTTHEYLSGAGVNVSTEGVLAVLASSSLVSFLFTVSGFTADLVRKGTALSFFVAGVAGTGVPEATFPKSNAVPGVFGVLVAEPKDAKAPVPRPKAEDAPVVGEETLFVVNGAMLLNGFERPPCELSAPPKRFEPENIRDEEGLGSLCSFSVARESLLELGIVL
jgi:hypothetical protein